MGDQISAAEVVGSQRSEQHILSSAAYLEKEMLGLLFDLWFVTTNQWQGKKKYTEEANNH